MTDLDTVIIEEDNDDVIFQNDSSNNNPPSIYKPRMDFIIIDDEVRTHNNIIDIIEIDDEPEVKTNNKRLTYLCNKIYREHKLLKVFVEKCLDTENTDGMLRVINRTLLCGYKDTIDEFKISPEMDKTMERAISLIETDPGHRFSHVKYVCEVFKKYKFRKKVQYTTLTPFLKGSVINKHKITFEESRMEKKLKTDITTDTFVCEVPVINLDEDVSTVNIDHEKKISEETLIIDNENCNKENQINFDGIQTDSPCENHENIEVKNNGFINSLSSVNSIENGHGITESNDKSLENESDNLSDQLLVPQRDEQYGINVTDVSNESDTRNLKEKKLIEEKIAFFKNTIELLEQEEVVDDSPESPYIKCENFKAQITKLYEQLCLLNGEEPVKRCEVRLKVADGHPQAPVRELEEFINSHIGSNGEPPFPDFSDVVECVVRANNKEQLGWTRRQILGEANQLFVQCGKALQKRRQRRDWRDMLGRVKQKKLEYDPADEDPVLEAKLLENRRIAMVREADLLARFADMEHSLPPKVCNPNLSIENDSGNEDHEFHVDVPKISNVISIAKVPNNVNDPQKSDETISCTIYTHKTSKGCSNKNVTDQSKQHKPFIDLVKTEVKNESEDNSIPEISTEDTNISNNILANNLDNPENSATEDELNVTVKREPEDVAALLAELGNDYTSTIIDMEDPFLVIEISSESSDGESDDER